MAIPVILIFDVGKTNKKLLLFNELYEIVYEESIQLKETKDEDSFPCEDVHALTKWAKTSFDKIINDKRFDIRAINFSAYGASFVNIDEHGRIITPLYNYLKPYPEKIKQQFYATYGDENVIARETASPVLGSLNSGLQLYRLKYEQPKIFNQIKYSLHLPQYLSCIFSNKIATDITSIGCHTMLWNFEKNEYDDWVYKEKLNEKFVPIYKADKINEDNKIKVGIGLHDSSSALIPYLKSYKEPFILISSGTWCISLNPFNFSVLTDYELHNDCLCYLSYEGKPVKASRIFAGYEHEQAVNKMAIHFNKSIDYYKTVNYDDSLSNKIKNAQNKLNTFNSYEEAYHALMIDIIQKQVASTNLVLRNSPVKKIFVDGGFSTNKVYMKMLANAYNNLKVYSTAISQATAIGAAIVLHEHWNNKKLPENLIELNSFQ
ncbi:MAG TPA: FGGY family carbohydrate kinase [Parafilimonas sp.]